MRTTILQPTYLPWLGYFEMIDAVDQFVIFDHVQFEPKSWQQRNRIRSANGELMLTIPVKSDGRQDVRIADKRIDQAQPWAKKHLRSIEVAYAKAPHFQRCFPGVRAILERRPGRLVDLTIPLLLHFLELLGLERRIVRSSDLVAEDDSQLGKTERVVNLCRLAGATLLYDGAAARDFLQLDQFAAHGIEVRFQEYRHPEYPQLGPGFLPYMGVIDLLCNCGPDALAVIRSGVAR